MSPKRFIVLTGFFDRFVEGVRRQFDALTPGDPMDPATTLAPVSSEQAAETLVGQVRDTVSQAFGGIKRSGYGRELSDLGIGELVNRKLIRTYPTTVAVGFTGG